MRKRNISSYSKLFYIAIIALISIPVIVKSYQWPIRDASGSHAGPFGIYGTLGEWRPGHLHGGVDIGCATGTAVYSREEGVRAKH